MPPSNSSTDATLTQRRERERRQRQQQPADRARVVDGADVLGHVADHPAERDLALVGRQLSGQDPQQCGLADAVGADQPGVVARRQPERDVGEQPVAAMVGVGEAGDDDVGHACHAGTRRAPAGVTRVRPG